MVLCLSLHSNQSSMRKGLMDFQGQLLSKLLAGSCSAQGGQRGQKACLHQGTECKLEDEWQVDSWRQQTGGWTPDSKLSSRFGQPNTCSQSSGKEQILDQVLQPNCSTSAVHLVVLALKS